MATPNKKLADSVAILMEQQDVGKRILKSSEMTRVHRERLIRHGFLREVIKGWLLSTGPQVQDGDTTPWYASFWEFCSRYSTDRFGSEWVLSPQHSLLIHAEATAIPKQVIINSAKGTNNNQELPFGTAIYDVKVKEMPPAKDVTEKRNLRVFNVDAALVKVSEQFFLQNPLEAQVVLGLVRDVSGILGRLLEGGHSIVAGRIAGAFRRVGRERLSDDIVKTMKSAGYDVRESDPFSDRKNVSAVLAGTAPIVARLTAIWESQRQLVFDAFPNSPRIPDEKNSYMKFLDGIYKSDAYHSLSLEGYSVTPELIERVRHGDWNPNGNEEDRRNRNGLAARGYWQAFQSVRESVKDILNGADPGIVARDRHRDWYRELFLPSVVAGILRPEALAGYRSHPVFLRGSWHVPPRSEAVQDGIESLFQLLDKEREASVRAVLGHWLIGYIHPYPDGNGRVARFLMNVMLASGGYPWTVVRVDDRRRYLQCLETASVAMDVRPFAEFIAERVRCQKMN